MSQSQAVELRIAHCLYGCPTGSGAENHLILRPMGKTKNTLAGIVGNVMQTVFGKDAYPSIEEKAAHLLYFMIKTHPFNDGNKRSAAFSFIWFLQQANFPLQDYLNPNTLTALTLLIAESDPKQKQPMVGLVLQLLRPAG